MTAALAGAGLIGLALYVGHHVGDYWVQTDHQAKHKGDAGGPGALACGTHVATYILTQAACLALTLLVGVRFSLLGAVVALAVSAGTHYLADRRERGIMFWLARRLPGKAAFLDLGKPRLAWTRVDEAGQVVPLDNPTLGTGVWALDQAWHIFWGVFVATLVVVGLS